MKNPPRSKQQSVHHKILNTFNVFLFKLIGLLVVLPFRHIEKKLVPFPEMLWSLQTFEWFQIQVFQSCYTNHSRTVGTVGPSAEIISNLNSQEIYSVTLIDNVLRAEIEIPWGTPAPRHRLQTFLVSISSATKLEKKLQHLKTSQWWNHMASFLIIDRPRSLDKGCSKAFAILSTAWKMNLLDAKFFCYHESKGSLIYSYNPYTDQAPLPWQLEKIYKRKNKHPWTLLVRSYQDSQEICKDLDFDQTTDLGGYEIRTSVYLSQVPENSTRTKPKSFTGFNAIIVRYMFRALNSKPIIFGDSLENAIGMTISGSTDISLNAVYQHNNLSSSMTCPIRSSGLAVITQHRGNLSQIGKLLRVIDHASRYAVVTVVIVAFLFFKFFLRQPVTTAVLTIVRLICNASVPSLPNNVAARIFLSALFIFLVTLQAIYQGKLASLLTKPVALPNVETFEDLDNFDYTTYGHRRFEFYFEKWNLRKPFVPLTDFSCIQYVLRDNSAACINEQRYLCDEAIKYNLHLSNLLMQGFVVFLIREDWPVEERLNTVLSRLIEGNIIDYVFMKDVESGLRKRKIDKKDMQNQKFTVMALKDLAFAFAILGVGLAMATAVFFLEVLTRKR